MRDRLTKRQSGIFKCLQEGSAVSGDYLAKMNAVSSKTIRKELDALSGCLHRNGANIISKTGVGYSIVVIDRERYSSFLRLQEERGTKKQSEAPFYYQRGHYIMRRLLTVDGYVKIGDLADELYTSRTTITADMRFVKEELGFYDIVVEQRPNHGITIKANEHSIRLCLVDEYAYYQSRQTVAQEMEYDDLMRMDEPLRQELEQIVFDALREFLDIDIPYRNIIKIIRLISLIPRRRDYSMEGAYSEEEIYSITQRNTYNAAKYIARRCAAILGYSFTREDLALLTVYLVGYRDFTQVDGITKQRRFLDMHRFAERLISELCELNGFEALYRDTALCNSLALHLLSMRIRMQYHIKLDYSLNSQIKLRIGSTELAVQCSRIIAREWGMVMDENEVCCLSLVIYPIFGRYNTEQKKKDIVIISSISKSYGQTVAERFYRNFTSYIHSITVMEVPELAVSDLNKYSCIFSDVPESFLPKVNIPIIPYSTFFGEEEKLNIRYILTLGNNHFRQVQQYFKSSLYFANVAARDKDDALRLAYQLICDRMELPTSFLDDITERNKRCSVEIGNNAALMKTLDCHTAESFMAVYIFDHPIQWKFEYVQILLIWHLNPADRVSAELFESGFFGRLLRSILGNSDRVVHLLQNRSYETFAALLKKFSTENRF